MSPALQAGGRESWLSKVYLPSCDGLQFNYIYEAMDLLHAYADKIEDDRRHPGEGARFPQGCIGKHPIVGHFAAGLRQLKALSEVTKASKIRIEPTKIVEAEKYDSKWILEPKDGTISLEDATCCYYG